MIDSKNHVHSKETSYRLSVLDTLLNRTVSEAYENGSSSDLGGLYLDSDQYSHHVSPPSSQNLSENGLTNTTIDSPLFAETKTPTTRSQQLPILLARNYYTAPACLLKFVNTNSTIRSHMSMKRDSDGTVIDNQFDPLVDCNVDTNDEMDNFKSDEDFCESFSMGAMTNRTSLMSDHQFRDADELPYIGVDPIDLNLLLQSVKSRYSAHLDKGCSPFSGPKESNPNPRAKETVDMGTSPLALDEPDDPVKPKPEKENKSESDMNPEPTELESYNGYESKNLNTTEGEGDFFSTEMPVDGGSNELTRPALEVGDFSVKKPELRQNQMPVYCRSLLYRIRVPLSKRLKNVDEDMLVKSMSSPMLSVSRVNLSCDRLYSSNSRMSNSADSNFSILRMSDLDSNSLESSRSACQPAIANSKAQFTSSARKPKRVPTGLPASEGHGMVSKRSRHSGDKALM